MSVDKNSLRHLPRCSSKNYILQFAKAVFTPVPVRGPVTRSHLFRNATGTGTVSTPPSHQVFRTDVKVIIDGDGLVSMAMQIRRSMTFRQLP